MVIPLGMAGGAIIGVLVIVLQSGVGDSEARAPGDPGDALAMLAVFSMLAGAAYGTVVGVIVAAVLSLKRKRGKTFK
jgi:hypothetical protein